MKDKDKKGYIVPYAWNVGGNIIGDPASNFTGLPLFLTEDPEEEPDEL